MHFDNVTLRLGIATNSRYMYSQCTLDHFKSCHDGEALFSLLIAAYLQKALGIHFSSVAVTGGHDGVVEQLVNGSVDLTMFDTRPTEDRLAHGVDVLGVRMHQEDCYFLFSNSDLQPRTKYRWYNVFPVWLWCALLFAKLLKCRIRQNSTFQIASFAESFLQFLFNTFALFFLICRLELPFTDLPTANEVIETGEYKLFVLSGSYMAKVMPLFFGSAYQHSIADLNVIAKEVQSSSKAFTLVPLIVLMRLCKQQPEAYAWAKAVHNRRYGGVLNTGLLTSLLRPGLPEKVVLVRAVTKMHETGMVDDVFAQVTRRVSSFSFRQEIDDERKTVQLEPYHLSYLFAGQALAHAFAVFHCTIEACLYWYKRII